jgi:hypothetical protein
MIELLVTCLTESLTSFIIRLKRLDIGFYLDLIHLQTAP